MRFLILVILLVVDILVYPQEQGPWEVFSVEVYGLKNIKKKLILKTVKAREKKIYYPEDKKSDIESLMNLGNIERASVEIQSVEGRVSEKNLSVVGSTYPVKVIYTIYEKPYIEKINILGNKKLSKSTIKSELGLDEGDFYDELKMREGIIKIRDKYKEKGYLFVELTYDVNVDTFTNKAVINIEVVEGNQIKVRNINVNGVDNEKIKRKIVKHMKMKPKKVFVELDFEKNIKNIEEYFRNNGYMEFRINSSTYTFFEGKYVDIELDVFVGRVYRFGKYEFEYKPYYESQVFTSDSDKKKLTEAIEFEKGEKFKEEKVNNTIRNIQEVYGDKGYLKVNISTSVSFVGDYVDIKFIVEENYPFYVRSISFEGNKTTKTKVFRREMVQKDKSLCGENADRECYRFGLSKIRRSQEKIYNLGFIDNIDMLINQAEVEDEIDLVFDITEGKPGMLSAGAGVSSKEGLMGMMNLSHLNMFGLANRLSLNWNFGKRINDYSVNWYIPWIYEKPTSLELMLFNNRRYRSYSTTYTAYTERRKGGRISVSPRFEDDKYALRFGYSYEKITVYNVKEIYQSQIIEGTSVQSSISIEFSRDTRDYIWDPTSGSRFSSGIEVYGGIFGGDINIYKPSFSYSYNYKLFNIGGWPFVFSIANRFGWVKGFSNTKEVPVYERYFLGGADSIRGYNSNGQIGPQSGGKVYYVTNIEFKFPLAREKKRTIVQWAFFFDIGNSWDSFDDVSFKIGRNQRYLKTGAGFGIRFTTPAFPIRLDWGYGFNHKPGEQLSDIYFTIGNLF